MGAVAAEPDVEVRVLICLGRRGNSSEFSGYRGGRGVRDPAVGGEAVCGAGGVALDAFQRSREVVASSWRGQREEDGGGGRVIGL
jgi:hypothetical protein